MLFQSFMGFNMVFCMSVYRYILLGKKFNMQLYVKLLQNCRAKCVKIVGNV